MLTANQVTMTLAKANMTREKCNLILKAILGSDESIEKWWNTPNKAFDLQNPNNIDIVKVYNYLLDQMESPH